MFSVSTLEHSVSRTMSSTLVALRPLKISEGASCLGEGKVVELTQSELHLAKKTDFGSLTKDSATGNSNNKNGEQPSWTNGPTWQVERTHWAAQRAINVSIQKKEPRGKSRSCLRSCAVGTTTGGGAMTGAAGSGGERWEARRLKTRVERIADRPAPAGGGSESVAAETPDSSRGEGASPPLNATIAAMVAAVPAGLLIASSNITWSC